MRILFVHELAGFQGGAEANVHQVAGAFAAQGHQVDLLYARAQGATRTRFLEPFENHGEFGTLQQAVARRPDAVYVHKTSDLGMLRQLVTSGLPLVRMVHDHDIYCQRSSRYFPWNRSICTRRAGYACAMTCGVVRNQNGKLPFKLAWPGRKLAEIKICRQFQTHIVQTGYMKSELVLHGFDPSGIRVLPVAPQQGHIGAKDNYRSPNILFVGQLIRGKGVDFLLRALATVRDLATGQDWKCTIAGEGSHLEHCRGLAAELGLDGQVTFAGRLGRDQLEAAYQEARLGVVPSVWPEPMGMVGLEFMWASLPVVAFDVGGISHWLEHGETGFLAAPRDTDSLAAGIARLLDDQALAEQMGRRAREIAEAKYRHDHYIDHLLGILREATASGAAPRRVDELPQLEPSTT